MVVKIKKMVATSMVLVLMLSSVMEGERYIAQAQGRTERMAIETGNIEQRGVSTGGAISVPEVEEAYCETGIVTPKEETPMTETSAVQREFGHSCELETIKEQERQEQEHATGALSMSDVILETLTDAKNDALSKYSNYYSKSIVSTIKSMYILSTYNYKQLYMNAVYGKISGSCAEVSATSVAEYYTRKGYAVTLGHKNATDIFTKMVNYGFITGAYTGTSTYTSKLKMIYTEYYKGYKKSLTGKYITSGIETHINNYNIYAKPMSISIQAPNGDDHTVTVAGLYDIIVKYKKKKGDAYSTSTYTYYAINDGYKGSTSGDARIQYVRKKYVYGATYIS